MDNFKRALKANLYLSQRKRFLGAIIFSLCITTLIGSVLILNAYEEIDKMFGTGMVLLSLSFAMYFMINAMLSYTNDFKLLLSYGVTRKNFFLSSQLSNLITVFVFSLILLIAYEVFQLKPITFLFFGYDIPSFFQRLLFYTLTFSLLSGLVEFLTIGATRFGPIFMFLFILCWVFGGFIMGLNPLPANPSLSLLFLLRLFERLLLGGATYLMLRGFSIKS